MKTLAVMKPLAVIFIAKEEGKKRDGNRMGMLHVIELSLDISLRLRTTAAAFGYYGCKCAYTDLA